MAAGYSGTPLATKLGIKRGHSVSLIDAFDGFESELEGLPEGVSVSRRSSPAMSDVTICFFTERERLAAAVRDLAQDMPATGSLWIAWPKKSSKVPTDVTEDVVRHVALPLGLVDNKVCAIDNTWSGLRLVVRREHRASWPAAAV